MAYFASSVSPKQATRGGRPRIHLDASGLPQRVFRKASTEYADGSDARLTRCLGVVGRVADRDSIAASHTELLQNRFEDIGSRLGFLDVVGRRRHVDQIADARDIKVLLELIFLGGGRDGDAEPDVDEDSSILIRFGAEIGETKQHER
jgi:hypothetical protein